MLAREEGWSQDPHTQSPAQRPRSILISGQCDYIFNCLSHNGSLNTAFSTHGAAAGYCSIVHYNNTHNCKHRNADTFPQSCEKYP